MDQQQEAARVVEVARAALAVARGDAAPVGEELAQLVADAAVGRALREAAGVEPVEPLVHICWMTPSGRTTGAVIADVPLHRERVLLADAAHELLQAATAAVAS